MLVANVHHEIDARVRRVVLAARHFANARGDLFAEAVARASPSRCLACPFRSCGSIRSVIADLQRKLLGSFLHGSRRGLLLLRLRPRRHEEAQLRIPTRSEATVGSRVSTLTIAGARPPRSIRRQCPLARRPSLSPGGRLVDSLLPPPRRRPESLRNDSTVSLEPGTTPGTRRSRLSAASSARTANPRNLSKLRRAGDRARTGDNLLGKQVLYQLSYARKLAKR